MNVERIGLKIRIKRKMLGMSQQQLAKKLGYSSRSTINKIEMGINSIPLKMLDKYAAALNCSVSDLLGIKSEKGS